MIQSGMNQVNSKVGAGSAWMPFWLGPPCQQAMLVRLPSVTAISTHSDAKSAASILFCLFGVEREIGACMAFRSALPAQYSLLEMVMFDTFTLGSCLP